LKKGNPSVREESLDVREGDEKRSRVSNKEERELIQVETALHQGNRPRPGKAETRGEGLYAKRSRVRGRKLAGLKGDKTRLRSFMKGVQSGEGNRTRQGFRRKAKLNPRREGRAETGGERGDGADRGNTHPLRIGSNTSPQLPEKVAMKRV